MWLRDFLFQQLGMLVSIVKQHIRPFLSQVSYPLVCLLSISRS